MNSIVIYDHEDDYHKPIAISHDIALCDNLDWGPKSGILHRYAGRSHARLTHWRHLWSNTRECSGCRASAHAKKL